MNRLPLLALLLLGACSASLPPAGLVESPEALERLLQTPEERPLVVHFWASWCPPCEEEFPRLAPALERLEKRGARVVLLSLDEPGDRFRKVPRFLRRFRVPGESYLLDADPEPVAALIDPSWPLGALPATFVFRSGRLVHAAHGPVDVSVLETMASGW